VGQIHAEHAGTASLEPLVCPVITRCGLRHRLRVSVRSALTLGKGRVATGIEDDQVEVETVKRSPVPIQTVLQAHNGVVEHGYEPGASVGPGQQTLIANVQADLAFALGIWLLAGIDAATGDPLSETVTLDVGGTREPQAQVASDGGLAGARDSCDQPRLARRRAHDRQRRSVPAGHTSFGPRATVAFLNMNMKTPRRRHYCRGVPPPRCTARRCWQHKLWLCASSAAPIPFRRYGSNTTMSEMYATPQTSRSGGVLGLRTTRTLPSLCVQQMSALRCRARRLQDRQVWPRQVARQRVPTEPGKRRDFVAGLLSATDDLADVVQAQQPVDALWPTVVLYPGPDQTLGPNLQSGFLANLTNCGGFGCFTIADKPTG
jgi:hypothetical protein